MKEIFSSKYSDDIKRDLYLAKFYDEDDPILGPLQGNVYLDKPWTKQFLKMVPMVIDKEIDVYKSLFHNYCLACEDSLDETVLFFAGQGTFTNRDLKEMAKNTAVGLQKFADRPKVAVFVNNSVEEPAVLLAASLCGGEVHFVDITKSPDSMKESIDTFDADVILMDEMMLPLVPYLNSKNLPVVVANTNKEYNSENMISFNELMNIGKENELKPMETFDPMAPLLVITSSGTTGKPKPIVHSTFSVNQAALKVLFTDYSLTKDNVMMKVIPAHIGLGIITTLYTCLISGTKLVFIGGNGPDDSVRNTINFVKEYPSFRKANNLDNNSKLLMFAAPMFYRALESELGNIDDLSYMGCMLAAGSKMGKEELDNINIKYAQKGCNIPVCVGYGSNENAGAVTLNSNSYNANGSGGFPIIGTDVLVVDDQNNPIINEEGRILVRSGSQFLYYLNMEEATKKAKVNIFGDCWVDMNDIGYIDENGFLFITGRSSRIVIRRDCKISIDLIEEKMRLHDAIDECAVLGINSKSGSDDIPYAFVTLGNKEYDHNQLMDEVQNNPQWLSPLEKPDFVIVLDDMPYMNNGKIDYIKLKEMALEHYDNVCKSNKGLIKNKITIAPKN